MGQIPAAFDEKKAGAYLGLSVKTLQAYRFHRKGPAYIRMGRSIRYRQEDLDRYLEACRVDPAHAA